MATQLTRELRIARLRCRTLDAMQDKIDRGQVDTPRYRQLCKRLGLLQGMQGKGTTGTWVFRQVWEEWKSNGSRSPVRWRARRAWLVL